MSGDRQAWTRSALAVLAGAVIAVAVFVVVDPGDVPATRAAPSARTELLAAWTRWRATDIAWIEHTVRRRGDRVQEDGRVAVAQRDGTVVVRDGDDVSAWRDGVLVGCVDGSCRIVTGADRFADDPAAEVAQLRAATGGDAPAYRVVDRGDGCYRIRAVRGRPATEGTGRYGDRTDVCFDEEGVAIREVRLLDGTSVTTTRTGTRPVTDDDMAMPAGAP